MFISTALSDRRKKTNSVFKESNGERIKVGPALLSSVSPSLPSFLLSFYLSIIYLPFIIYHQSVSIYILHYTCYLNHNCLPLGRRWLFA